MIIDASFWVAVSFILSALLIGKKFAKQFLKQLDQHAHSIKQQISETTDLYDEAQRMHLKARASVKKNTRIRDEQLAHTKKKLKDWEKHAKKKLEEMDEEFSKLLKIRKKHLLDMHEATVEKIFFTRLIKKVEVYFKKDFTAKDRKKYILQSVENLKDIQ